MTVFLIIMIPISACFGFVLCALCQAASAADRQDEKLYAEWQQKHKEGEP